MKIYRLFVRWTVVMILPWWQSINLHFAQTISDYGKTGRNWSSDKNCICGSRHKFSVYWQKPFSFFLHLGPCIHLDYVLLFALNRKSNIVSLIIFIPRLYRPPDKSAYWKTIFFISHPNICCGYWKEPSQWDGSFVHPKHMFKSIA